MQMRIASRTILLALLSLLLSFLPSTSSTAPPNSLLNAEALALLAFKASADLDSKLHFSLKKRFDHCQWTGVKCAQGKVVRLVIEGFGLRGTFATNTLTKLDQLRVLSLQNNSLSATLPDLTGLINLKTLFLDHNSFSGNFPPSILYLHRLRTVDLSYNDLSGPIPSQLTALDRLYYLRLESNHFNGTVPPLNQSSLRIFNVSGNNFSGIIPATPLLVGFDKSAFSGNPGLCGEVINKQCESQSSFFASSASATPPPPNQEIQGSRLPPPSVDEKLKRTALVVGFSVGSLAIIGFLVGVSLAIKKMQRRKISRPMSTIADDASATATDALYLRELDLSSSAATMPVAGESKARKMQGLEQVGKSGNLVFCAGEPQVYTVEQLMRASAEMLGRGTMGTTYKAVLDNQLIVSVKRLDASKVSVNINKEAFERHLASVGNLRHPNLVPLRAYFQAKEERLLVYDFQPNGSLFSLIHGSRSARGRPLHWTSCLKIAEDVAQGLAHIHQTTSRLVHGNIKSSNVLLGADFEACLTDYCLTPLLMDPSDDPESAAYLAPETRKSNRSRVTTKSDVYSFGMLLLELLTGRPPSQQSSLVATDLTSWALSSARENEQNRLAMLLGIATACIRSLPEQRPTTWQVLKMIQEVKETQVGDE